MKAQLLVMHRPEGEVEQGDEVPACGRFLRLCPFRGWNREGGAFTEWCQRAVELDKRVQPVGRKDESALILPGLGHHRPSLLSVRDFSVGGVNGRSEGGHLKQVRGESL